MVDFEEFVNGDRWLLAVISGIRSECQASGACMKLMLENSFSEALAAAGNPAGWIICPHQEMPRLLDLCNDLTVPWLATRQMSRSQSHNFVSSDDFSAGRELGVSMVVRRLLPICLATETHCVSGVDSELFQGLLSGIIETGGAVADLMTWDPNGFLHGLEASSRLPRAVICANERIAMQVCRQCHDRGLQVPGEIALIVMGPSPLAGMAIPSLTAVERPAFMVGVESVRHLLSIIRSGSNRVTGVMLPCEMCFRESLPPAG